MLIVPELKRVFIQPPRTASTSLREAMKAKYPKTIPLYRHMEWMGVPRGYENYQPVYVSRDPANRMVSLWRYMRKVSIETCPNAPKEWLDRQRKDSRRTFIEWFRNSVETFNDGDTSPDGAYYNTFLSIPANRKGYWNFMSGTGVGPDLVEVVDYLDVFKVFDLEEVHVNASTGFSTVPLRNYEEVRRVMLLDYRISKREIKTVYHLGGQSELSYI